MSEEIRKLERLANAESQVKRLHILSDRYRATLEWVLQHSSQTAVKMHVREALHHTQLRTTCYQCSESIVAEDDDVGVCIECGGRNRRKPAEGSEKK